MPLGLTAFDWLIVLFVSLFENALELVIYKHMHILGK